RLSPPVVSDQWLTVAFSRHKVQELSGSNPTAIPSRIAIPRMPLILSVPARGEVCLYRALAELRSPTHIAVRYGPIQRFGDYHVRIGRNGNAVGTICQGQRADRSFADVAETRKWVSRGRGVGRYFRPKDRPTVQGDGAGNRPGCYVRRTLRIDKRYSRNVVVAQRGQHRRSEWVHDRARNRRMVQSEEVANFMGRDGLHVLSAAAASIELHCRIENNIGFDDLSCELRYAAVEIILPGTVHRRGRGVRSLSRGQKGVRRCDPRPEIIVDDSGH